MLSFASSVKLVGGVLETVASHNAAAYYAGYMASRISKFHYTNHKTDLKVCSCNILTSPDMKVHLFNTFKEYQENVPEN